MPDLLIRDVPDDVYEEVERLPPRDRTMVEAQVIACLRNEVRFREARCAGYKLERIRAFRETLGNTSLPPELVAEAIKGGRA